ncbi:putative porin [Cardinium endosymbiont of Tipula unca]|uniref:putative porin n=1 Tax=Cardinium endosymbiont of Tipula unca TaxID=3066216 RepID=UPI0030CAD43A
MVDGPIWLQRGLFLLFFGLPISSYGEKPEDIFEKTTEENVAASATFFITPRDVMQNYRQYHPIDRSITKMDRFTVAEQHNYHLQNLGNNWTAAQHIYYTLPKHIGATYGFSAYDFYFQNPRDIYYYYTSKAYAHFNIVLANLGSFVFDSCYTHRLSTNWHMGINMRSAMTENEWPSSKDDKIVDAFPHFDIFTHFRTLDECYHLFTSFSNMRYVTKETGGVRSSKHKEAFAFEQEDPARRYQSSLPLLAEEYMKNKVSKKYEVLNKDLRRNFYIYHHYEFSEQLQLYHELDYNRKNNLLTIDSNDDELLSFIADSDPSASLNQGHTTQPYVEKSSVIVKSLGNEIGIKGDIDPLQLFYSLYYRLEKVNLTYDFSNPNVQPTSTTDPLAMHLIGRKAKNVATHTTKGNRLENEHYLGFNTRLNCSNNKQIPHKVHLHGEWLPQQTATGYYKLDITYENKFFKLNYNTVKYKTPYMLEHGYSRYRRWNHHFASPHAKQISAEVDYAFPFVRMNPTLSFKRIWNHLYYSKAKKIPDGYHYQAIESVLNDHCIAKPMQATTPIDLFSWGGNLDFCFFSCFHFDNSITFFKEISSGTRFFRGYVPPYMYTGRYYYANQLFGKKMDIETGINLHFKALYYADGYDIVAQQFYRQNQFAVQGKAIIDLFINFRISNLKISLKYSYINDELMKPKAYFATPFYPGQKKAADIGIHWSFFD